MNVKHVNVSLDLQDLPKGAYQIAKLVRSDWKWDDVEFRKFTEGITNQLIGVYDKSNPNDMILVRIHGPSTELFIDRNKELEIFKFLHDQGCAPELYLTFENGMAFEYLPGVILNSELCQKINVYTLVAKTMAKIHKMNFGDENSSKEPQVWNMLEKFIDLIPDTFSNTEKQFGFLRCCREGKSGLKMELNNLRKVLPFVGNPVVFCHNDVILTNVIFTESKNSVTFIDYEYAGYNYQAYDLAMHFTAFADEGGFENPQYPSEEYQLEWIRVYLKELKNVDSVDEDSVQKLYRHVCQFTTATNFLCAVWNFMQAEFSPIDFDYIKFASDKYGEYKKSLQYIQS